MLAIEHRGPLARGRDRRARRRRPRARRAARSPHGRPTPRRDARRTCATLGRPLLERVGRPRAPRGRRRGRRRRRSAARTASSTSRPTSAGRPCPMAELVARPLRPRRAGRRPQRGRPGRAGRAPARRRRRLRRPHLPLLRRGRRRRRHHRRPAARRAPRATPARSGHVPVNPDGWPCGCGSRGCWETEVGERALLRNAGRDPDGGPRRGRRGAARRRGGRAGAVRGARRRRPLAGHRPGRPRQRLRSRRSSCSAACSGGWRPCTLPIVPPAARRARARAITREPVEVVVVAPRRSTRPLLGAAERAFEPLLADPARRRAARSGPSWSRQEPPWSDVRTDVHARDSHQLARRRNDPMTRSVEERSPWRPHPSLLVSAPLPGAPPSDGGRRLPVADCDAPGRAHRRGRLPVRQRVPVPDPRRHAARPRPRRARRSTSSTARTPSPPRTSRSTCSSPRTSRRWPSTRSTASSPT